MGYLLDALAHAYRVLGFDRAAGGDEVFRAAGAGADHRAGQQAGQRCGCWRRPGVAPAVVPRRSSGACRVYAKDSWRQQLSAACAAHAGLGPASLVLYDVSTLYFETDAGDGFREPGFSKERRLEPQITIGLLTDQDGFPLMVSAFEGNKAETKTMLPVIEAFMAAHQLPDVTVVADAGMVSRGEPEGDRGRRAVVHPRQRRSRTSPTWSRSGGASTPARTSPTGTSSPSPGPPGRTAAAATRSSTTSTGRPGPPHAARHRRAGRQGREGRRRARPRSSGTGSSSSSGGTQQRQPRAGGQGPGPGRAQGLRHQPARPAPTAPRSPRSS